MARKSNINPTENKEFVSLESDRSGALVQEIKRLNHQIIMCQVGRFLLKITD